MLKEIEGVESEIETIRNRLVKVIVLVPKLLATLEAYEKAVKVLKKYKPAGHWVSNGDGTETFCNEVEDVLIALDEKLAKIE